MIKTLLDIIKNPKSKDVPEGICPNCWGEQDYGNMIREMHKDKQIDVNSHSANHAFIQDFVTTNLDGIKLRKTVDGYECKSCKLKANK